MEHVIEQAKRLAEAIATNERTLAFQKAAAAVDADPVASRIQQGTRKRLTRCGGSRPQADPAEPSGGSRRRRTRSGRARS
jgi:hypothetical protein